jgi:hypothetical protein
MPTLDALVLLKLLIAYILETEMQFFKTGITITNPPTWKNQLCGQQTIFTLNILKKIIGRVHQFSAY